MFDLLIAPTPEDLGRAAANFIARAAANAVSRRGEFFIALSGGSTPLAAYAHLATWEGMSWAQTHIFWSDERCVPPEHPDSNFGSAQASLLARLPVSPVHINRIRGEDDPGLEARRYEAVVRQTVGGEPPRFDIILLGLGTDGHTASLFPGGLAERETERLVVAAAPPIYAQHLRVTFTLALINAARNVVFLVAGAEKAQIVARMLSGRGSHLPAGRAKPTGGKSRWILDAAAASSLGDALRRAGRRAWAGQNRPAG
jgi:6-phosphogluconolactonase